MASINILRTRLELAKEQYVRTCENIDRELTGLVRTDPVHIKSGEQLQADYPCTGPDPVELVAAEQPEEPVAVVEKTKKGKK